MSSVVRRAAPRLLCASLLAAACVGGCARRPTTPAEPAGRQQLMQIEGTTVRLEPTTAKSIEHDVELPADRVWALLPAAYDALGLPLTMLDTPRRTLGAGAVRAQGRLKGTWMSRYVECGVSATGLPNADSYVVVLDVRTQLVPSGDGARAGLSTAVRATGRPSATATTAAVNCVSTGSLERRVAQVVRELDAKAP